MTFLRPWVPPGTLHTFNCPVSLGSFPTTGTCPFFPHDITGLGVIGGKPAEASRHYQGHGHRHEPWPLTWAVLAWGGACRIPPRYLSPLTLCPAPSWAASSAPLLEGGVPAWIIQDSSGQDICLFSPVATWLIPNPILALRLSLRSHVPYLPNISDLSIRGTARKDLLSSLNFSVSSGVGLF